MAEFRRRVVYEPAGKAREYSYLACNLYRGCGHRCSYCYAPSVLRLTRAEFCQPAVRPGVLEKLRLDCQEAAERGEQRQILLCFTCDPYQELDERQQLTRHAIDILHAYGQSVVTLTKGGRQALRDIDKFIDGDAFATSLTCCDDGNSQKWEPGAALPQDRIDVLKAFHDQGTPTWVSIEPVIHPAWSLELIERSAPWVDEFRIGKMNHHPLADGIDWADFGRRAVALCERLGANYMLKVDLKALMANVPQGWIPEGVQT